MRLASDGIPIAAIVARETTAKAWQGTGSGIGFGTGGLGLMFGGVAGATTEQSNRARGFTLPGVADLNLSSTLGPFFGAIIFIGIISVGTELVPNIIRDGGKRSARIRTTAGYSPNHRSRSCATWGIGSRPCFHAGSESKGPTGKKTCCSRHGGASGNAEGPCASAVYRS